MPACCCPRSARPHERRLFDTPAIVDVIPGRDLEERIVRNAEDVFRHNPPDLDELKRMLREGGVGSRRTSSAPSGTARGWGYSYAPWWGWTVGRLRRPSAASWGRTLRPAQIEFINLIIEHLTEQGAMSAARLYEPPFTDLSASGVEGVFSDDEVEGPIAVLTSVRRRAAA